MRLEDIKNTIFEHEGKKYKVCQEIETTFVGGDDLEVIFFLEECDVEDKQEVTQLHLFDKSDCVACEG